MQIGWVDYSKEDRQKVLSVIDLLSESGTIDELGLGTIRDGFADLFFPGTSTIQTRAKYFLIVPYALDSLAHRTDLNPSTLHARLEDIERRCGEIFLEQKAEGSIGQMTLRSNRWVKRAPSSIYWAGIRKFGIFTKGAMSINEYLKIISTINKQKKDQKGLGQLSDEEYESDDCNAGDAPFISFWKLPEYPEEKWMDDLSIDLTQTEAEFLKNQIETTQPDSLLAYILKHEPTLITKLEFFSDLNSPHIYSGFPEQIRRDITMALHFSRFIFGAQIRYNIMISAGKNDVANREWASYEKHLDQYASINISAIFQRLQLFNPRLKSFLVTIQQQMLTRDIEALDQAIRQREIQLKGESRAKLNMAGSFSDDQWYGGREMDYRFNFARRIIEDIVQGLEAKEC